MQIEIPNTNCVGCKFLKNANIKNTNINVYTCVLFDSVLENYPNKCVACKNAVNTSRKVLLESK